MNSDNLLIVRCLFSCEIEKNLIIGIDFDIINLLKRNF